jgi:hypothetical protein
MITRNTLLAMGAAALLTASFGLAQTKTDTTKSTATKPPAAAKAPAKHVMTGTIDSITGTGAAQTVVIKSAKSTDKPVTLMLNSATTKKGDLVQGAKVTANYHVDNGQNIATSIEVAAAKPAATAKTTSTTSTSTTTKAK